MATHITFVKKILSDGNPCAKCADVEARLVDGGYLARIDETLIADERDNESPGMVLAHRLEVERAPFFVVRTPREDSTDTGTEDGSDEETVYTVFFKFLREVLEAPTSKSAEAAEILRDNPELDLL